MPSSKSDWDAKHLAAAQGSLADPAGIIVELLPLLPRGPALDLACGIGRHTLLLAKRQQPVTAVDWSSVALEILEVRARAAHLESHRADAFANQRVPPRPGITLLQADLERVQLPVESFELILCFQYLQRSLFRQIERALRPGGMLLFETHTQAQLEFAGGPRNPAFLLEPGELRTAFRGLEIVFYRELRAGQGTASLLARRVSKKMSNSARQ